MPLHADSPDFDGGTASRPARSQAADGAQPSMGGPRAMQYDRLRDRLRELSNAPVRDMVAIDAVLRQLDEAHAAFKAHHATADDRQRY